MSRVCTRFVATTVALLLTSVLVSVSAVKAYDDQASIDVAAGYSHVPAGTGLPSPGALLSLGGGYGLGDMFVLRGSLGYALHLDADQRASVGRARVEMAYALDVLSVVPFFGLGGGAYLYDVDGVTVAPSGHALAGLDVLLTREWNMGLDLRMGFLLTSTDTFAVTEAELRLSRMFELF